MEKAKAFFGAGGAVIGYGRLPKLSLTLGKPSAEIAALRDAVWGADARQGSAACRTNARGGKSYFLAEQPTPEEVAAALADAGVPPPVLLLAGRTDGWVHALRRVDREGREVLFITNQNTNDAARTLTLNVPGATDAPEIWDAMRGEISSVPWKREADGATFALTVEANESALVRFGGRTARPARVRASSVPVVTLAVVADASAAPVVFPVLGKGQKSPCPGTAFQGVVTLPQGTLSAGRRVCLACDMAGGADEIAAAILVNGAYAGGFIGKPCRVDITAHLKTGRNALRIEPFPVAHVRVEVY